MDRKAAINFLFMIVCQNFFIITKTLKGFYQVAKVYAAIYGKPGGTVMRMHDPEPKNKELSLIV